MLKLVTKVKYICDNLHRPEEHLALALLKNWILTCGLQFRSMNDNTLIYLRKCTAVFAGEVEARQIRCSINLPEFFKESSNRYLEDDAPCFT